MLSQDSSKLIARASIKMALNRLTNLTTEGHTQMVKFLNKSK